MARPKGLEIMGLDREGMEEVGDTEDIVVGALTPPA